MSPGHHQGKGRDGTSEKPATNRRRRMPNARRARLEKTYKHLINLQQFEQLEGKFSDRTEAVGAVRAKAVEA